MPRERRRPAPGARTPRRVAALGHGELWQGDAVEWLATLPDASADLVVADPPYNAGKAEWDSFASQEAYVAWSMRWIAEAARVLKPTGTLFVCGWSEALADLRLPASRHFAGCRWLVWHYRNKANLGRDWGRSHESILHLRKSRRFTFNVDAVREPYGRHTLRYPARAQAESSQYGGAARRAREWRPHPLGAKPRDVMEIPTTSNGMAETTPHPTQKPEELVRRLVLAASNAGDLVLDPFVGSGTTAVVAEQLGRRWLACDLNAEYLEWARRRVAAVEPAPEGEWARRDRENAEQRRSIR